MHAQKKTPLPKAKAREASKVAPLGESHRGPFIHTFDSDGLALGDYRYLKALSYIVTISLMHIRLDRSTHLLSPTGVL